MVEWVEQLRPLKDLWRGRQAGSQRKLERAAALKDGLALLELAPKAPWHAEFPVVGAVKGSPV